MDKKNINMERLVVDTSYLLNLNERKIKQLFACDKIVIPSPILEELGNRDKNTSYISRRINSLMLESDVHIEPADCEIQLDPTWEKDRDYYIATVCVKLQQKGYTVGILTCDKQLALRARTYGVKNASFEFSETEKNFIQIEDVLEIKPVENIKNEEVKVSKISRPKERKKYEFVKPKRNNNAEFKLDFAIKSNGENSYLLEDNANLDFIMQIWRTVIDNKGNQKEINRILGIPNYVVEETDEVLVFKVLKKDTIALDIGNITKDGEFKSFNTEIVSIEYIEKVNKKYNKAIKEAFKKLLKIAS